MKPSKNIVFSVALESGRTAFTKASYWMLTFAFFSMMLKLNLVKKILKSHG